MRTIPTIHLLLPALVVSAGVSFCQTSVVNAASFDADGAGGVCDGFWAKSLWSNRGGTGKCRGSVPNYTGRLFPEH